MADVVGGGTSNVTLYDEDGRPVGTPAVPLVVDTELSAAGPLATEASAVGIRADLGTDGATPTGLVGTGVRGWLRSIFDRLADGSQRVVLHNSHGLIANPLVQDTPYGYRARFTDTARVSSSGRLALTLSGNLRAILVNPATLDGGAPNTQSIRVERVDAYVTANGFASVLMNVTGGIPTTPRRPKLNPRSGAVTTASAAGQPAIVVAEATNLAFTGGVDTGVVLPLQTDQVVGIDVPITLAPGQNLALTAPYAKGVDAVFTFYWGNI